MTVRNYLYINGVDNYVFLRNYQGISDYVTEHINVAVIYPLLGCETTYIVICSRDGLKEPGAMGNGSDITTLSL